MNNNPNNQFNPTPMDNSFGQPQPVVPPVQPVVSPEPQPVQPQPVVTPQPVVAPTPVAEPVQPVVAPQPTPMAQPQSNMYQQPVQPQPTVGPQPMGPQQPVYQQPVYQQPVQPEPPKKSNKAFLIIVIILILVIIGLVVFFVMKKTNSNSNSGTKNNNTTPVADTNTNTNTNVNTTPVSSGNKVTYDSFEFDLPSGYETVEDPNYLHIVNYTKRVESKFFVERGYTVESAIASLDELKASAQKAGITISETKEININNQKFLVLIGVAENIPVIFTYNTIGNYSVASSIIYNVGSESNDSVLNEIGTMLSNGKDKNASSFSPGENKKYEVKSFDLKLNDLKVNK